MLTAPAGVMSQSLDSWLTLAVTLVSVPAVQACGGEQPVEPERDGNSAAPAQLAFVVQPSNTSAGVPITPRVEVAIQDAAGNVVPTATNAVTVAIGTNTGGGTLSGTTTVAAVGIAAFNDLSIDRAGAGYTLVATAGNLANATSASFDVTLQLAFTVQPSQTEVNAVISPAVQVAIQDGLGNVVTSASDEVTVTTGTNRSGGTLSGTTVVNAVSGIATFSDLSIDRVGGGYTLVATSGSVTSPATSAEFETIFTVAAVSAAGEHTCGLQITGSAYCWGRNDSGQLGDGSTTERRTPVRVAGTFTFATLSAGFGRTCGVAATGAAYCWGVNTFGQLGDGTSSSSPVPVLVQGGLTFATLSAGGGRCGVTTSGAAYCWGDNTFGQLGDGTVSSSPVPVLVQGGLTFATLGAGAGHTCGVTTSGAAYCWGYDKFGQLGDGSAGADSPAPVLLSGGLTFATLSGGNIHTCGVTPSGAAYCWGFNGDGQLGVGMTSVNNPTPLLVQGNLTFSAVSAGDSHTCGLATGGAAYCWGENSFGSGQLGDGTFSSSPVPVLVQGGLTFATLSAGADHTCGVTTSGAVYCWGNNNSGQLGDGSSVARSGTPVRVSDPQ